MLKDVLDLEQHNFEDFTQRYPGLHASIDAAASITTGSDPLALARSFRSVDNPTDLVGTQGTEFDPRATGVIDVAICVAERVPTVRLVEKPV